MPSSDDRPNILLLMTDEHRGDALGIEGHPVLQTPYLDSIGGGDSTSAERTAQVQFASRLAGLL